MGDSARCVDFRKYYFFIALIIFALDQSTKWLVAQRIEMNNTVTVVPGFFSISHVLNPGAAFSLFADSGSEYTPIALIVFSLLVLIGVSIAVWRFGPHFRRTGLALAFILGGALGNLLDRIRIGSVVDFLMFKLGQYHWPDFNVADSAIVVGSIFLIGEIFFHRHEAQS